jgi:N-acetylmuramoyl-L-alanine amidase
MKSKAEIISFQKAHGLVPDGIIGPQTRKVMRELATPPAKSARKEPDKAAINKPATLQARPGPLRPAAQWPGSPIQIPDTKRPISGQVFHCTATPEGRWFDRADVNAWHKQRGWPMIGYHFLILINGTIQVGRPIGMVGSHVKGWNTGTIGIAYVGGLTADGKRPKDTRTPEQIAAAAWLIGALKVKFKIKGRAKGHNEYDRGKACPSFNMAADVLGAI